MNNKNENSRFRYKAFVIINSGCKQYGVNILKQQKIEKLFFFLIRQPVQTSLMCYFEVKR